MLKFTVQHVYVPDEEMRAEFRRLGRQARNIIDRMEMIMVDTQRLLDAVERAKTESASLRELVRANNIAMKEVQDKLEEALARPNLDKQELERVQMLVDKAADDLSLDDQDVQDLIKANTPADTSQGGGSQGGGTQPGGDQAGTGSSEPGPQPSEPQPPAEPPAAEQGGGSQSGSGGSEQAPQPLPGTGVEPPPEQPQGDQKPQEPT